MYGSRCIIFIAGKEKIVDDALGEIIIKRNKNSKRVFCVKKVDVVEEKSIAKKEAVNINPCIEDAVPEQLSFDKWH